MRFDFFFSRVTDSGFLVESVDYYTGKRDHQPPRQGVVISSTRETQANNNPDNNPMRIQETSSIFDSNLEESALASERFREGSTCSMSAIRINVEKASNDGREDFVRNVSPRQSIDHNV